MSKIKLTINGRLTSGITGQTIYEMATQAGIHIPTLCENKHTRQYSSCGICTVEVDGAPKLLRSCSTYAQDGMVVQTDTEWARRNRRAALELLMSAHSGDCLAPCKLACPAKTDCQGYVGLIAGGLYKEAFELIKDKIPFPASIGRICPHPCEDDCRRSLVEEPISIAALKGFVGDMFLENENPYPCDVKESTGKKVAIAGGGPAGLTTALKLRLAGHEVDVYEAMPKMGGMLRYGIPEYRLPKNILDAEIAAIQKTGIRFHNNVRIGKDKSLESLRNQYDAVVIAAGAWTSTGLRCKGEDLQGVIGGIDFLRAVTLNEHIYLGANVAIVGGGNTAMDACRTAVRLGVQNVYNIYRRTRNEMPAEEIEIKEAEEEGVIFKNLTNPLEVIGKNGRVSSIRLQIMELGEPDSSGRRAPVAVDGAQETLEVDMVIVAIGQKADLPGFDELKTTKWGTIIVDEVTYMSNQDKVFAVGECANDGPGIAVTAIGHALKAAEMIDKFLHGIMPIGNSPYLSKTNKTTDDFTSEPRKPRLLMPHRDPEIRREDFLPVNLKFSEDDAKKEAMRCLECGCYDYFECKLLAISRDYELEPEKYAVFAEKASEDGIHGNEYIKCESGKCVLCGLCIRTCNEVVGAGVLGLVGRGIDTVVMPALKKPLGDTDCISCGMCVYVCPTGALTEVALTGKAVPVKEVSNLTVCPECSLGCKIELRSYGNIIIRSLPGDSLLCVKGRFKSVDICCETRIITPLIKGASATFDDAVLYTSNKFRELQSQYGYDSIAVVVSGKYTNEEAKLIVKYASEVLKTQNIFSGGLVKSAVNEALGARKASLQDIAGEGLIVAVNPASLVKNHGTIAMRIRQAVNGGAKLVLVSDESSLLDDIADCIYKNIDELRSLAENKSVFVYPAADISFEEACKLVNFASQKPEQCRILEIQPEANSRGLADLNVKPKEDLWQILKQGTIKGLFAFGELDIKGVDFVAMQCVKVHKAAEVIFPASVFFETSGTYTNAYGSTNHVKKVVAPLCGWDNTRTLEELQKNSIFQL